MRRMLRVVAVLLFTVIVLAAIMILVTVTPPANIPSLETLLTNPPPTPEFMISFPEKMKQDDLFCVSVDSSLSGENKQADRLFIDHKFISFLLYSWGGGLVEGKENAMSMCPFIQ